MPLSPLINVSPGTIPFDRADLTLEDIQNLQELAKRDSYAKDAGMLMTQRAGSDGSGTKAEITGSRYGVIADSFYEPQLICQMISSTTMRIKAGSAIDGRGRIITLAADYDIDISGGSYLNKYVILHFTPVDSNPLAHPITSVVQNHKRDGDTSSAIVRFAAAYPFYEATDDWKDDVVLDKIIAYSGYAGGSSLYNLVTAHSYSPVEYVGCRMMRSSKHMFVGTNKNNIGSAITPSVDPGCNVDRFLACKGSGVRSVTNPFGETAADTPFTPIAEAGKTTDNSATTIQGAIQQLNDKTLRRYPNMVKNPNASMGKKFWTNPGRWVAAIGGYGEHYYFYLNVVTPEVATIRDQSSNIYMSESAGFILSGKINVQVLTAGQIRLEIIYYNSSNTELLRNQIVVNANQPWCYHSLKTTSPVGTAYARIGLVADVGTVVDTVAITDIKLEQDGFPYTDDRTAFNDDELGAVVKDHMDASTLDHPDNSVTDAKIGNRTIVDTTVPATSTGLLLTLLNNIAYMLKLITGAATWRTTSGYWSLTALFNKFHALTGHMHTGTTGDAPKLQDAGLERTLYDSTSYPNLPIITTPGNNKSLNWLPIMLNNNDDAGGVSNLTRARLTITTSIGCFPFGYSTVTIIPDYPTSGDSSVQASGFPALYGVLETFRHKGTVSGGSLVAYGSHQIFTYWEENPVSGLKSQLIRYWKNSANPIETTTTGWTEWISLGQQFVGFHMAATTVQGLTANVPTTVAFNLMEFMSAGAFYSNKYVIPFSAWYEFEVLLQIDRGGLANNALIVVTLNGVSGTPTMMRNHVNAEEFQTLHCSSGMVFCSAGAQVYITITSVSYVSNIGNTTARSRFIGRKVSIQ